MKITEGIETLAGKATARRRLGWRAAWYAACVVALLLAFGLLQTALAAGSAPLQPATNGGAAVQVGMSPATKIVDPNTDFTVDVYIAAGTNQVTAADVHLSFDTDYLQVTKACSAGGALPVVAGNLYDNAQGTIDFGAYKPASYATGTFTLCTIYFHALDETPETLLTSRGAPLVVAPGSVEYTSAWVNGKITIGEPAPTIPLITDTPTATSTAVPTETSTPVPTETPTPSSTPTKVPGEICVAVYHELDNDLVRDAGEPLLAGAQVQVSRTNGTPIATYETDGIHEPHCFELPPDEVFIVSVTSPAGYIGYGPQMAYVSSISGYSWSFDVAQVEIDYSTSTPTPTVTATPSPTPTVVGGSGVIDPETGGKVRSQDGLVEVSIPAGAVTDTITVTITYVGPAFDPVDLHLNTPAPCLIGVGRSFLVTAVYGDGEPVEEFQKPITITTCYAPAGVPDDREDELAIYYWDAEQHRWIATDATYGEEYCVSTSIDHVGLFSLGYPGHCLRLPIIFKQGTPEPV